MNAFSNNIFAVLDDDVEETGPPSPPTGPADKADDKKGGRSTTTDKSRAQKSEARIRPDYPSRGRPATATPSATRGSNEERPPRDRNVGPRLQKEGGGDFTAPREQEYGSTTPGDRGGPREPRRGGRGGYRGRGREFDRHSGTGKVDSQKKETVGWGDSTTAWEEGEINIVAEAAVDAVEGEVKVAEVETTDYVYEAEPEPVPEPEEEKVKTLDEYLAEKAQKTLGLALPEARQPNEGSDDSKWKDTIPLDEEEDEAIFIAGKEHSYRVKHKQKKERILVDIEQRFSERSGGDRRSRGGRGTGAGGSGGGYGDRGGNNDRGGGYNDRRNGDDFRQDRGSRGGFRGGRSGRGSSNGVDVDDVEAFPSLGSG